MATRSFLQAKATAPDGRVPITQRLVSLDAFRGAVMALMVLVNNSGDGSHTYGPLNHSDWNGWTITDVVFPSFLWIVGVAMTFSLGGRLERGASKSALMLQAFRRAAIIYALGLLVYLFPFFDFGTMRILGVLQRIGICYFLASAIYLWTPKVKAQIAWIVALLGVYWLLMAFVPVPGFGAGRLDVEGNLSRWVDWHVLGVHNYSGTKTWDPEGIISTLPAIATALFGILAGHVLRMKKTLPERTTIMFVAGNALIALGLICDIWLPINKKLWTSSFSLFMAGLDFVLLSFFVYFVDGQGYKRVAKPAVIMGMNAITIYMLSELLAGGMESIRWGTGAAATNLQKWLFATCFAPVASPYNAALLWAVVYTLLMYVAAYAMYKKQWFVRI
jgi:predicted acyltransferase